MSKFKNPITGETFINKALLLKSLDERNCHHFLKSNNITKEQLLFNHRNKFDLNKKHGKCVISGLTTNWNEQAKRYERFHSEEQRREYREIFKQRMINKHGKVHLLNDPNKQREMLANRRISGEYTFNDGTVKQYTGKEELSFLKFLNEDLNWLGEDIHSPAPQNIFYTDENGIERFYIPDVYFESLNLIVEIKGEMHNGFRNRDIKIEQLKDEILSKSNYKYFKIENRNYMEFDDYLHLLIEEG